MYVVSFFLGIIIIIIIIIHHNQQYCVIVSPVVAVVSKSSCSSCGRLLFSEMAGLLASIMSQSDKTTKRVAAVASSSSGGHGGRPTLSASRSSAPDAAILRFLAQMREPARAALAAAGEGAAIEVEVRLGRLLHSAGGDGGGGGGGPRLGCDPPGAHACVIVDGASGGGNRFHAAIEPAEFDAIERSARAAGGAAHAPTRLVETTRSLGDGRRAITPGGGGPTLVQAPPLFRRAAPLIRRAHI